MTAEETGVYITLIARMYEMAGAVERDDERLYRICGCKSKRGFVKILDYLKSEGKVSDVDGMLSNEKVEKIIKKVVEKSSSARDAAQARWDKKTSKNNGDGNADAVQTHMRIECQPKPKPKDTNVSILRDAQKPKKPSQFQLFWDTFPHRGGAKKGRAKAEASYARHFKAGTSEQEIIEGAKMYARDRQVTDGYAKDPTTWLNGKGWQDDIEPSKQSPGDSVSKIDKYNRIGR